MTFEIASWRSRMRSAALRMILAAVVGRGRPPHREALLGGFQRLVEIGLAGVRQVRERLLGRRIDHVLALAAAAVVPLAVDVEREIGVHGGPRTFVVRDFRCDGLAPFAGDSPLPPAPPPPSVRRQTLSLARVPTGRVKGHGSILALSRVSGASCRRACRRLAHGGRRAVSLTAKRGECQRVTSEVRANPKRRCS